MLIEESVWIRDAIAKHFNLENFPILNIGSSTGYFRKVVQPQIHNNIFLPLLREKKEVIHLDMKMDEGVDIIGDLSEKKFRDSLKMKGIKSILCSNLLEHLENPKAICNSILDLLDVGGLIIVTVPHNYPFHKDPIDTMFRPSVKELHAFFPATEILESEIVASQNSYKEDLIKSKKYLMMMMIRWLLPFYKFKEWKYMILDLFKANNKYSATCIVLKKSK